LNRTIVRMLRNRNYPLGLLASCLVGLTAIGLGSLSPAPESGQTQRFSTNTVAPTSRDLPATSQTASQVPASEEQATTNPRTKTINPQGNQTQTSTPGNTSTANAPAPTTPIEVSLTINDTYAGKVALPDGKNQCDVLQEALADNIINSLDMRYSSQYKTYAVYVINGVGDSGSVWWTYKVNGISPPLGCANVKAHDGDSVTWEYVKQ
jgi:hypothetical protein